jgi:DNA-binding beta-propeller fold protein YncE
MKKLIRVLLWCLAGLVAIAGACAALLIYPGTPSAAHSLEFQGYIPLPRSKLLSVLDYVTISGTSLFVTDESAGNVYKVTLRNNALPRPSDVWIFASEPSSTHGVAIDPASHMGFVTRSGINTVDVFDPASMMLVKRIHVADDPDAIVFDPSNKIMYVANGDARLATLIDPATQATVGSIELGGKAEFAAFDPQTKLMYQNLEDLNSVVAVDLAKRSVEQRWPLRGCEAPTAMVIDEVHRRLFIGCKGNDRLAVFDLNQHQIVAALPIGGGPDSIAFDLALHRLYTTGKSGILTVIQQDSPDTYRTLDSIHMHYGAHTLGLDPATHMVYVAYAALVVSPRLAVFAPRH